MTPPSAVRERNGRLSGHGLSLVMSGGAEAVAEARGALALVARDLGPGVISSLRLLVSELVANSVKHGGAGRHDVFRLEVAITEDRVRTEVTDLGRGFVPRRVVPRLDDTSGWGLLIVDRLSDQWGTDQGGRCVWAELARDGGASG